MSGEDVQLRAALHRGAPAWLWRAPPGHHRPPPAPAGASLMSSALGSCLGGGQPAGTPLGSICWRLGVPGCLTAQTPRVSLFFQVCGASKAAAKQ